MPPAAATVDALLFDLGGVLVDIDFNRAFGAWANAAQVPASQIAGRFAFDQAYEAHERGEIDADGYFAHLRNTLGLSLSSEELLAGWNAIWPRSQSRTARASAQAARARNASPAIRTAARYRRGCRSSAP
jgi:putative hydrolase of the HAD superfamily